MFAERKAKHKLEVAKCFYRIVKWRLSQNDCMNRGYVFDNPDMGPKDFELLFLDQKKNLIEFLQKNVNGKGK